MKELDLIGQPCPLPVIHARKALEEGQPQVRVLVDNSVAVQNLKKMADGLGFGFSSTTRPDGVLAVELTQQNNSATPPSPSATAEPTPQPFSGNPCGVAPPTILFSRNTMGGGAEELGQLLLKGFIFSLTQLNPLPHTLIFLNSGAYLTASDSAALEDLTVLAEQGVRILTCGTCINFYALSPTPAVGESVNMYDIAQALAQSGNVVNIA